MDFSFNETSLEPECTTNLMENATKYIGTTNYCNTGNETNDKTNNTREANGELPQTGLVTSNCLDTKPLATSSTTSSTEPSVVRNLIEKGSYINDKEISIKVFLEFVSIVYSSTNILLI